MYLQFITTTYCDDKTITTVLFQLRRSLCASCRDENHTDGGLDTLNIPTYGYKQPSLIPIKDCVFGTPFPYNHHLIPIKTIS